MDTPSHEAGLPLSRKVLDRARLSRDARFDGRFFIGVTSTGIYCRPICPAPAPKTKNVRYFPSAAAAAEAGFRPCLRCRPEASPGTPAWLGTSATVSRGLRLIGEGALDEGSVESLAQRLGVTSRHLHRLFVKHLGAPPLAVAQTRRLHFAKKLIDETDLPMTQVALAAGFGSVRRFNGVVQKIYGRAPTQLRRNRRARADSDGVLTVTLSYRPPFAWPQLREFLASRAIAGVEEVTRSSYRRSIICAGQAGILAVSHAAHARALVVEVAPALAPYLMEISARVRALFDLEADPAAINAVLRGDPALARHVRSAPGLRVPGAWDRFELAVRAILGQQVTVAGATTLAARLVERCGETLSYAQGRITHLFPQPHAVAAADLAGIGMPGARVRALQSFAQAVATGVIDLSAAPETVRAQLAEVKGIGPWTIEYIAMRALREPDAFPAQDIVLRRACHPERELLRVPDLRAIAESWRPWRAYAVMQLWRGAAGNQ